MKWPVFFALVSIALVAGEGAWKENKKYQYKVEAKTVFTSPDSSKQYVAIYRLRLTICALSADILIGQITEIGLTGADEQESVSDDQDSNMNENESVTTNKEFIVHLKNGVIHSLSVDRTTKDINQLKFIVSQFQVDTQAKHVMHSENNQIPDANTNTASYKTMESTVTGECETAYDIARLPEYLANASQDAIPLPGLAGEGQVIEIVESKNYNNCNGARYLLHLAGVDGTNQTEIDSTVTLNTRILLTGTLADYTIQSSVTTNKVADLFEQSIYLTLESVEQSAADWNFNYNPQSMENIVNLVYTMDSHQHEHQMNNFESPIRLACAGSQNGDIPEGWSGCWSAFPSGADICKNSFSTEWVVLETKPCGVLDLGKMAKCRHSYKGCEATTCYSTVFWSFGKLCKNQFGDRLPITKGGIDDCFTGFARARCCPKSYE